MKITTIFLVAACLMAVCFAAPANQFIEYEDEPVTPAKPAPRAPLLRRNPLAGRAAPKTTTTTTAAPKVEEELEEEDEEFVDEEQEPVTTTEAPKKFIKGGIVRPFRSNDELLAALKRRREQASNGKSHAAKSEVHDGETPVSATTSPPKRATSARRKFNFSKTEETDNESTPVPASTRNARRFSSRA